MDGFRSVYDNVFGSLNTDGLHLALPLGFQRADFKIRVDSVVGWPEDFINLRWEFGELAVLIGAWGVRQCSAVDA